jgi:hypothetical protein
MIGNTTGSDNAAIGFFALRFNSTGNNNIAIGSQAAAQVSGANSNNIHIGSEGAANDTGTVRIGTSGLQSQFFVAGVRGVIAARRFPKVYPRSTAFAISKTTSRAGASHETSLRMTAGTSSADHTQRLSAATALSTCEICFLPGGLLPCSLLSRSRFRDPAKSLLRAVGA